MSDHPPPSESRQAGDTVHGVGPALGNATPGGGEDDAFRATDVTDRRQVDDPVHQARKMEAMGRLAGAVAHDFNNVLTVITGYAQILEDGLPLTDPRRDALGHIARATDRATSLTRQLLAFSRRQALVPTVLDLGHLIRDLEPALRRLLGAGIALRVEAASDLRRVKVDRPQFEQVIMNLVANARDAMPDGGTVTMQVCNEPDYEPPLQGAALRGPYVQLSIRDTGPGMDPETRDCIFEPFLTIKSDGRKTGLALAMAYGVVQQSGGFIDVSSAPGCGSTFTIHLPQVEEVARPPAAVEEALSAGGCETVLVVEDDDLLRRLAVRALRSRGYDVLEAGDGLEALRMSEEHAELIHLLLTDVVMPNMSGRQLAETMVLLRPDIRVLYMSGHNQDAILQQGIETSRVEFLPKPFTRDVLASRVRRVLDAPKRV